MLKFAITLCNVIHFFGTGEIRQTEMQLRRPSPAYCGTHFGVQGTFGQVSFNFMQFQASHLSTVVR